MKKKWPINVRFAGLGGQGLVTVGAVLAEACAGSGLQVAASQSYGSQARGGMTRADVIISNEAIDFPHVLAPDILLAFAQEAYDKFVEEVSSGGIVLADPYFVTTREQPQVRQLTIDATKTALEKIESKLAANFVMLGALLGLLQLVESKHIDEVLPRLVPDKYLKINRLAFESGYDLGTQLLDKI